MQYPEDASKAAAYLREAIPLMVKHSIEPNPRNFSLWYAYVAKRNPQLNSELDAILNEYKTCPPKHSADLFRRYIIDDEVDFSHRVQAQLANVIGNLTEQSSTMSEGSEKYDTFLSQGIDSLQEYSSESDSDSDIKSILASLLEQTRQTSELTQKFQSQMQKANQEISLLREEIQCIEKEASLDALTQISNRRAFDKELQQEIDNHNSGTINSLCLIVTDIDHFKRCNDKYGHVMGDKVLQSFAQILSHISQDVGLSARYGGEEFVVILPDHTLEQACQVAEKIRATTERMKIKQRKQSEPVDQLTTSVGVALHNSAESATAFIERADSCLYKAKESGRNRVIAEHQVG